MYSLRRLPVVGHGVRLKLRGVTGAKQRHSPGSSSHRPSATPSTRHGSPFASRSQVTREEDASGGADVSSKVRVHTDLLRAPALGALPLAALPGCGPWLLPEGPRREGPGRRVGWSCGPAGSRGDFRRGWHLAGSSDPSRACPYSATLGRESSSKVKTKTRRLSDGRGWFL